MKDFVELWIMHKIGGDRRKHMDESDQNWETLHHELKQHDPEHLLADHTRLFRVHTTHQEKPQREDYDDQKTFEQAYQDYQTHEQDQQEDIDFDQHWVSFTDSLDVIGSDTFAKKRLRGLVIVMRPHKAIKVYPQVKDVEGDFDQEKEVVAPLIKDNVIEILPFAQFIKKYGQGTSDYEKA